MKQTLPRTKAHYAGEQFILDLKIHKDIFLSEKDVEVETFDSWDFYKVSVFRWSKNSAGCGTKEYRTELWKKQQKAIEELFDLSQPPSSAWRWIRQYPYPVDHDRNMVVGKTYFVKKA